MRKRGRPPSDTTVADVTIALTVHQLAFWGFSLRSEIYELVGSVAGRALQRTDHVGRGLGPDRIEQIYEEWKNKQEFLGQRWRYTKATLQERVPNKLATLAELIETLLRNGGEWPEDANAPFVPHGDPILTPKAHDEYTNAKYVRRRNRVEK